MCKFSYYASKFYLIKLGVFFNCFHGIMRATVTKKPLKYVTANERH